MSQLDQMPTFPSNSIYQVSLDVPRAILFNENKKKEELSSKDAEKDAKYRKSLSKVLTAYQKRNSSYEYIQSHCFIACRLLEICRDSTNATFWLYVSLMEHILPVGYFSRLMHVQVAANVFDQIFERIDPYKHS